MESGGFNDNSGMAEIFKSGDRFNFRGNRCSDFIHGIAEGDKPKSKHEIPENDQEEVESLVNEE
jgi:hypothetical protein